MLLEVAFLGLIFYIYYLSRQKNEIQKINDDYFQQKLYYPENKTISHVKRRLSYSLADLPNYPIFTQTPAKKIIEEILGKTPTSKPPAPLQINMYRDRYSIGVIQK